MNGRMIWKTAANRILPVMLIAAAWQAAAWSGIAPLVVASPHGTALAWWELFVSGDLFSDIWLTLVRALGGCAAACVTGIPLGLAMGYSDAVYDALEFPVEFFRSIPATALLPVFMLLFGVGDLSKIALSGYAAGLTLALNAMYGVHIGKELRRRAARTLHITGFAMFRKIVFPEALPHIAAGFRVALSLSLVVVIVPEMFAGSTAGLGKRIIDAQQVYRTDEMYAAILTAGLLGFFLNRLALYAERRVIHWRGK